ncbi:MAG: TerB family tellurite resistance protein [Thiotrichales bacterium]|nr:MAG: TerB family tellurite resistance protein [Thiotrichales bacterium]
MIVRIRQFFERHIIVTEDIGTDQLEHQLRLASAALMIEVLYADHAVEQAELDTLRRILQDHFELTTDEADNLIQLADEERIEATDYYQFTSLINEFYTQQQKRELITRLWQMAYADNKLHKFEEHLVRRLADLLHVPHAAFIQSKHEAASQPDTGD